MSLQESLEIVECAKGEAVQPFRRQIPDGFRMGSKKGSSMAAFPSVQRDACPGAARENIGDAANFVDRGLGIAGGHEDSHYGSPRNHCSGEISVPLAPRYGPCPFQAWRCVRPESPRVRRRQRQGWVEADPAYQSFAAVANTGAEQRELLVCCVASNAPRPRI